MTDKELTEWEHQSHVITVLTSREMGAWLGRRDNRILQEIQKSIMGIDISHNSPYEVRLKAYEIIDKHIKEFES